MLTWGFSCFNLLPCTFVSVLVIFLLHNSFPFKVNILYSLCPCYMVDAMFQHLIDMQVALDLIAWTFSCV